MRQVGDRLFQAHVFLQGLAVRHGLGHQVRDFVGIERLVDVVVRAVLQRGDGGLDRGVAGHDDDQHVGIDFVQAALQLDAVGAAHLDIDQRDVESLLGHAGERFVGALGGGDVVALFGKPLGQRIADAQFIINNQQFTFSHFSTSRYFGLTGARSSTLASVGLWLSTGNKIVNVVPCPTTECTAMLPPWRSTMFWLMARPSPEPPDSLVV